jgi:zinc transport system permease protein
MVPLPWPFDREYMQLALVAAIVVGACAPLIGTFLVQKRQSLLGDGIGHVAFAGVALGLLVGVWPIWTALLLAVAGAVGIELLRTYGRTSGDLALALLFYTGIALAVVLSGLADALDTSTLTYLFGSILTVTRADALTIGILGVLIVVTVAITWRGLFSIALDEEAARVSGLPVDIFNIGLAALTAVTVVVGMRAVGVLLVAALMVLPVGAAQRLTKSFARSMLVASAIGIACAVAGLVAARSWALAPGGTIVLVAAGIFAVTAVASTLAGGRALAPPADTAHTHHH